MAQWLEYLYFFDFCIPLEVGVLAVEFTCAQRLFLINQASEFARIQGLTLLFVDYRLLCIRSPVACGARLNGSLVIKQCHVHIANPCPRTRIGTEKCVVPLFTLRYDRSPDPRACCAWDDRAISAVCILKPSADALKQ